MIGSITGDIVGSVFERNRNKSVDFSQFIPSSRCIDDTVPTDAVAKDMLKEIPYGEAIMDFAQRYPHAGAGYSFYAWIHSENNRPNKGWGNGSAMRVSPVGFAFDDLEKVLLEARLSAEVTHDHAESLDFAQTCPELVKGMTG
jgi:ADP-ribosylglycohydrolase